MKTIEIIPIDYKNIDVVKTIDVKDLYITSLTHIPKLLSYNNYPIKNRFIAVKSILDFLEFFEMEMQLNEKSKIVGGAIPIHTDKLIKHFSRNTYNAFLKILSELNIVKRVTDNSGNFYIQGQHSCLYVLDKSYQHAELCFILFDKERKKNVQLKSSIKIDPKFKKTIALSEINVVKAIQAEIKEFSGNRNQLRSRISRILAFTKNDRFITKGVKVDRIFHSLSQISRIARPFVTIKGKSFNSIDIKNCQPLLLCAFLEKNNLKYDPQYKKDCESGVFYEQFKGDRENVKTVLYRCVFFSWQTNFKKNKQFKELYPLTWNSMNEYLKENKITVASTLQNLEASIMNDITPKISDFYYTLFDEINYTNIADKQNLEDQISKKFSLYKITPSFKNN